jgi:6-pyruvoyltetrahydropterin/6-carboxytetrahydropterin synthase
MARVRVTKEFTFDMAHALFGYDGPCKNIHGHTYRLAVTLLGEPVNSEGHPKNGMVIDFAGFKDIVKKAVIDVFDHALALNKNSEYSKIIGPDRFDKVLYLGYQPTCENLLLDIHHRLTSRFPSECRLVQLKLDETPTSSAEWRSEDNI